MPNLIDYAFVSEREGAASWMVTSPMPGGAEAG